MVTLVRFARMQDYVAPGSSQTARPPRDWQNMRGIWRPFIVIVLALLVPIVPFLLLGESLDRRVDAWLDPPPPAATVALVTVAVLAVDVFLPVPSSLVSTFAGAQLGIAAATAASWLGMMAGAIVAFGFGAHAGGPWRRACRPPRSSTRSIASAVARAVGC